MKEVTYEEWLKNPTPRMMWVWDNPFDVKQEAKVICVAKSDFHLPVMTVTKDYAGYCSYRHCAEIEEPKKRRMTYQELAWWLRDNNRREYKYAESFGGVFFEFAYDENEEDILVEEGILIRENGGEWHEPIVEVEE